MLRGYDSTTKNPQGEWNDGYQGKLCSDCKAGFKRNQDLTCSKWPQIWVNVIFILLAMLGIFAMISFMVYSVSNANTRSIFNINILFKVLLNHIQLMAIITAFKFNWPESVSGFFAGFQPIMNISIELVFLLAINTMQK